MRVIARLEVTLDSSSIDLQAQASDFVTHSLPHNFDGPASLRLPRFDCRTGTWAGTPRHSDCPRHARQKCALMRTAPMFYEMPYVRCPKRRCILGTTCLMTISSGKGGTFMLGGVDLEPFPVVFDRLALTALQGWFIIGIGHVCMLTHFTHDRLR